MTLAPDDLKKFMKDLRRYWQHHFDHVGIRFFAAGEYGGKTLRPHYHAILYNLPLNDLVHYKRNFQDDFLYNSKCLTKIWGKGYVVVGKVTFESSAYVARYITKKVNGPVAKSQYAERGLAPEFSRMSRMPGIGRNYFNMSKDDLKEFDRVFITTKDGVKAVGSPKYFDRLFKEQGVNIDTLKGLRQENAIERSRDKSERNNMTPFDL